MNETITLRLYENPDRPACKHCGPFKPTDAKGWGYAVGDTLGLEDDFGGYRMGTITELDPTPHNDDGHAYKLANLILED